ncbi:hypothetical protein T439DRAFT_327344 [Meredithblackwellia eburnea MCA 4105]
MVCFFIPLVWGTSSSLSQERSDTRICPKCSNANVEPVKVKKRFELCWVPLVPMGTKELWFCNICQWSTPIGGTFQPAPANGTGSKSRAPNQPGPNYVPPPGRGYDVGYVSDGYGGGGYKI